MENGAHFTFYRARTFGTPCMVHYVFCESLFLLTHAHTDITRSAYTHNNNKGPPHGLLIQFSLLVSSATALQFDAFSEREERERRTREKERERDSQTNMLLLLPRTSQRRIRLKSLKDVHTCGYQEARILNKSVRSVLGTILNAKAVLTDFHCTTHARYMRISQS